MSLEIETVFRRRAHNRGLLLAALHVLAEKLRRYFIRRATHRALSGLNDAELQDIGLMRTSTGYRELHKDRIRRGDWQ